MKDTKQGVGTVPIWNKSNRAHTTTGSTSSSKDIAAFVESVKNLVDSFKLNGIEEAQHDAG